MADTYSEDNNRTVEVAGKLYTKDEYIKKYNTVPDDFEYLFKQQQASKLEKDKNALEEQRLNASAIANQQRRVQELETSNRPGAAGALVAERLKLEELQKNISPTSSITLPAKLPTKFEGKQPAPIQELPATEIQMAEQTAAKQIGLPKLVVEEPAVQKEKPLAQKAAVLPFANYNKSMAEINKDFEKDRQLAPEVKDEFTRRQGELQQALTEARSVYDRSVSEATTAQERREAAIQWASIAESLGQSMVKFFAAQRGARTGQLLGTKVQFEKYDWQKDLDRSLSKLKQQTDQAKVSLGISREDIEEGTKALKEEQKTALQEREAVAKQRATSRMDLLKEEIRQKAKSEEDYVEAVNRLRLEGVREQRTEAAATQREQAAEAKAEAAKQRMLVNNYAELEGLMLSLAQKDTPKTREDIGNAATKLGIPKTEVDKLIDYGTGKFLESKSSEEKTIRGILEKYKPVQTTRQTSQLPAKVKVKGVEYTRPPSMTDEDWQRYITSNKGVPVP